MNCCSCELIYHIQVIILINDFITIFIITDTESKAQYPLTSSTTLLATFSYAVTSSSSDTTISPTPIVTKGI